VGFGASERRACQVIGLHRSVCRYVSQAKDQTALMMRIRDLAVARVRYGYRRLAILLRREGWRVNDKRVYRLYRLMGLSLRLQKAKKRISRLRGVQPPAGAPNEHWSMDFMADTLHDGRRFRVLTIVDHVSRVSPAIEASQHFPGQRVVAVLERLRHRVGLPKILTVDNGPEFAGRALDAWAHEHGVRLDFTRPGKPTDNAYIESFNGKLRAECLDQHWFVSIDDAKAKLEAWRIDYNRHRPHSAIGDLTPDEFARQWNYQERLNPTAIAGFS